jgi:hypothetical protein
VADALSRKGQVNNITTHLMSQELCWEMEQLNLGMCWGPSSSEGPQKRDLTISSKNDI